MITVSNKKYLEDCMSIDINHFCKKMQEYISYTNFLNELLDTLFLLEIPTDYFNKDRPWDSTYSNEINQVCQDINEKHRIKESSDIYFIADTIRHVFSSYKKNGLLGLYKNRETEDWYPRVKISQIILPNNIDSLEENIVIYRGTRETEYNSGRFSQSWTLDKDIASRFPISNTGGKKYLDKKIILKTIISKKDIFYFDSADIAEQEVIIDTDKIKKDKVGIVE